MRKRISAVLATAAVAALGVTLATPATADPLPRYDAVGSDTIQDVFNALANTPVLFNVDSWDAFGSPFITTKIGGTAFPRPAGSGQGIAALSHSLVHTDWVVNSVPYDVDDQVDIARSSRGPNVTGSDLVFIPFARDAVTYAFKASSPAIESLLDGLTTAQLTAIYSANSQAEVDTALGVNPAPGQPGYVPSGVVPVLPQSASGTRQFFLGAIGVSSVGTFVRSGSTVAENDGTQLDDDELIPYSAAQWIAQTNGVAEDLTDDATLGVIDGVEAVEEDIEGLVPNDDFYESNFGRDTYVVLSAQRVEDNVPGDRLVGNFAGEGAVIRSVAAQSIITQYGFLTLEYAGDTDLPGGTDIDGFEDFAQLGGYEL